VSKSLFVLIFIYVSPYLQKICPKMNAEVFELVTVRRWQRSATAEGRWGSLTKCGVTENVTDRRSHDGPSCRFVRKIREVAQYPYSKSSSVLERRPSTDRCACNDPSYLPSRVMKRVAEEISSSMGRRSP